MSELPDIEIIAYMKSQNIPLIDAKNMKEAAKAISETLWGWDIVGKAKAETELSNDKIIICKLVNDWVQPYAKEGRKIPLVLFSTHPEWKTGTRFDAGLMECTFIQGLKENNLYGYTVLVFDQDHKIYKYIRGKYHWEPNEV
jgi:hypothetical protein